MTPQTPIIDRSFRGVGRIKRSTGTTNPAMRGKLSDMLTALHEVGRFDILRAIRDGKVTMLAVYDAWRRRALDSLPLGETAQSLGDAMQEWLDSLVVGDQKGADCSAKHHRSMEQSRKYMVDAAPKALVADIADVLEGLRDALGKKHPTSFNHCRAAALTFIRKTLKRSHPLYVAVAAVERRKIRERDKYQGNPLSVEQMEEMFPHRDTDPLDAMAWSQATTGMHEKEYWGEWSVKSDRVRIGGTKRPGRLRDVPLVLSPAVPSLHPQTFAKKIRERSSGFIEPYDLRRTYANWLEAAGILRARRKMYMGHSAGDITGLYERHDVDRFLIEDAAKLREYLQLPPTKPHTMTLHKGKEA